VNDAFVGAPLQLTPGHRICTTGGMGSPGHIDREKHDADVVEHVMKGVSTESGRTGPRGVVVNLGVQGWLGGLIVSAVQVEVLDESEPQEQTRRSRRHRSRR
jgi:hypothetical protein